MPFAYKTLELGALDQHDLEAALNNLGVEGWELVAVVPPQIAILKRQVAAGAPGAARAPARELTTAVAAKYRDPETGETWSGRGRMAGWLADRVKAGARADDFLI